jgi:hypothetical protein
VRGSRIAGPMGKPGSKAIPISASGPRPVLRARHVADVRLNDGEVAAVPKPSRIRPNSTACWPSRSSSRGRARLAHEQHRLAHDAVRGNRPGWSPDQLRPYDAGRPVSGVPPKMLRGRRAGAGTSTSSEDVDEHRREKSEGKSARSKHRSRALAFTSARRGQLTHDPAAPRASSQTRGSTRPERLLIERESERDITRSPRTRGRRSGASQLYVSSSSAVDRSSPRERIEEAIPDDEGCRRSSCRDTAGSSRGHLIGLRNGDVE